MPSDNLSQTLLLPEASPVSAFDLGAAPKPAHLPTPGAWCPAWHVACWAVPLQAVELQMNQDPSGVGTSGFDWRGEALLNPITVPTEQPQWPAAHSGQGFR